MRTAVICLLLALAATLAMVPIALADAGPEAATATAPSSAPAAPYRELYVLAAVDPDPAPNSAAAEEAPVDIVRAAYDAIVAGEWKLVAALALSLLVLALRKWGDYILPAWFRTDRGGVVLVFFLAFAGSLAHAGAARAPIGLATLEAALMTAVLAIGGYAGLRRFVWPKAADA